MVQQSNIRRVLVIGAAGFLGRRIVARMPAAWDVVPASRRRRGDRWEVIDLADPARFIGMRGFDAVVNASDSAHVSPRAAAEFCLQEGVLFVEAAHDFRRIRELLELRTTFPEPPGAVLVGMGVFPGLTNVLAREAYAHATGADSLAVCVSVSVMSGAGRSMCRHMADHMRCPALYFDLGELRQAPAMQAASPLPAILASPQEVLHPAALVSFPELLMLRESTGVGSICTMLRLQPAWLTRTLRPTAWLVERAPLLQRGVELGLIAGRGVLCRSMPAHLTLTAAAYRRDGAGPTARVDATCDDGVGCAASAIVAGLELLSERRLPRGVLTPDEVFTWSDLSPRVAANEAQKRRPCQLRWTMAVHDAPLSERVSAHD